MSVTREGAANGIAPLECRVEAHDARPDECTLFPSEVDDRVQLMTQWITAEGDAFVDRREMA